MTTPGVSIDLVPFWAQLNDELVRLVDYVPDDRMGWSPREGLWELRRILLHLAASRDYWMGKVVGDGDDSQNVYETAVTRADIQQAYRRTWARVARFLGDPAKLAAEYREDALVSGHWIAFHVLEHDIHHRAGVLHYLALLGIETPEVGVP